MAIPTADLHAYDKSLFNTTGSQWNFINLEFPYFWQNKHTTLLTGQVLKRPPSVSCKDTQDGWSPLLIGPLSWCFSLENVTFSVVYHRYKHRKQHTNLDAILCAQSSGLWRKRHQKYKLTTQKTHGTRLSATYVWAMMDKMPIMAMYSDSSALENPMEFSR